MRIPGSSTALVAAVALAFGFLAAVQLRAQLITPSNRLERNQALVHSVQELERENAQHRQRIAELRSEIRQLEAKEAQRSAAAGALAAEVADLRARVGETPLRGPGVVVDIGNGRPSSPEQGPTAYLATYQDVQDVVNLLFAGGAEGVAVNGRRISPLSHYQGAAGTVVVDQGPPLTAPFHVSAVGNRSGMEELLSDPSTLGDLRFRQRQYGLQLSWTGLPDVRLPAYDASLHVSHAQPG